MPLLAHPWLCPVLYPCAGKGWVLIKFWVLHCSFQLLCHVPFPTQHGFGSCSENLTDVQTKNKKLAWGWKSPDLLHSPALPWSSAAHLKWLSLLRAKGESGPSPQPGAILRDVICPFFCFIGLTKWSSLHAYNSGCRSRLYYFLGWDLLSL